MKISIKTKLALIFLSLACFIGVMTSLIVNSLITNQIINEAQERVKEDLNTARYVYTSRIKDIEKTIRWVSIRHVVRKALQAKNILPIREELLRLMAEERLDFLTLVDQKGIVVHRFHNPRISGDSLIDDPFIQGALSQKVSSGTQDVPKEQWIKEGEELTQRATLKLIPTLKAKPSDVSEGTFALVLKSAHPIIDLNGKVLGALCGGVLLTRNYEIVDQIKNIIFKNAKYKGKDIGTATIFLNDVRVSTNVLDKEGKRAIGTRAMKEVQEQVLEKGLPWIQRAFVVDEWYITAYEPIKDIQDRIIGILYVGILENKYAVMKERLILVFFLLAMSAMLVALTVSFLLSWKIQRKSL